MFKILEVICAAVRICSMANNVYSFFLTGFMKKLTNNYFRVLMWTINIYKNTK